MDIRGWSYRYVGPADLKQLVRPGAEGQRLCSAAAFRDWASARTAEELAEPFTFVVDAAGVLRLAPRRSEHVACAGGETVLSAGEVSFYEDSGRWAVNDVSNQSTGYCPDISSWRAVAEALDQVGVVRPSGFTHEVAFRRCPGCGQLNIVREADFICVFCDELLPQEWNVDLSGREVIDRLSTAGKLHANASDIDVALVVRLIAAQFPQWAGLPVEPVDSAGTSNAMYRLGEDMVVRLPRIPGAARDVEKEHQWLPRLAPPLPVAIPVPLGKGIPANGYPWPWSVYRWLDGENPAPGRIAHPGLLAEDLAEFVAALHLIDPTNGPPSHRSEALATRDDATRDAIGALRGMINTRAVTAVWNNSLRAPAWPGPAVWLHADLQPGNLLIVRGRLSAVIDFGCLGVGDPAVDLIVAWYLLPADAREVFRAALKVDDAAWTRGRGWALSIALDELRDYQDTHPVTAAIARHVVQEVLSDDE